MCFKSKWKDFKLTKEYLSVVKELTSITKLHSYSKNNFKYIPEKGDYWKTPIEFMNDGGGDCEDWARFNVDVLVRIIGIKDARFVIVCKALGNCHAVCIFPYQGKYSMFTNEHVEHNFESPLDAGKWVYPSGLKYMEIRNWTGKVLKRKFKLFGTF